MRIPRHLLALLLGSLIGGGALGTAGLRADPHVDVGISVGIPLPHGYVDVVVGPEHYYSYRGQFYHRGPHGFVLVRAPRGAIVRELPPHCARIYVRGVVFYRFGDVYYQAVPQGYIVVDAPAAVRLPPPPPPVEYQSVWVGTTEYLFKDGQFFLKTPDGMVWTQAPLGAVTKVLPADATSVWYEEVEYFEVGDVYFRKTPEGYRVVAAPWKR